MVLYNAGMHERRDTLCHGLDDQPGKGAGTAPRADSDGDTLFSDGQGGSHVLPNIIRALVSLTSNSI